MKLATPLLVASAVLLTCAEVSPLQAASTASQAKSQTSQAPRTSQQPQHKLKASDADVTFALTTVESALKQYHALPEAKKRKLEAKVAKVAGVEDVSEVSLTLRMFAASAVKQSMVTKENRERVRTFLDANPKWCGTVKATRLARRAMAKMGVKGELSLDQVMDLLPE